MVCYDKSMTIKAGVIVTVNVGSSSIKVVAFTNSESSEVRTRLVDMSISNIGQPLSILQIMQPGELMQAEEMQVPDHMAGAQLITKRLADFVPMNEILAVGHRLVHGGVKYFDLTPINKISDADWHLLTRLDPEHTPSARQLITQFSQAIPSALQVACFDTAFFQDLPYIAKIVPIPKEYYKMGVRRYGFHGLSYISLLKTFREKAGETAVNGRVILAHLGSGVSVTATRFGKPIDTTMGFTPTSGTAMSTRTGDLDPHVFSFLRDQTHMSLEEFEQMVSFKSGLLGVSGVSGDMHTLLGMESKNDDAKAAIELFVRDIKKSIGALSATLGGIDSLIFSGGIGEQSSLLRTRICQSLEYLGIEINDATNRQNDFLISSKQSKVGIHVISTDEAQVIATQTAEFLNASGKV